MRINVNCKHCDAYLTCQHPGRDKWLGLFRRSCVLPGLDRTACALQERYPLPVNPPRCGSHVEPPPPQRIILEVRLAPDAR